MLVTCVVTDEVGTVVCSVLVACVVTDKVGMVVCSELVTCVEINVVGIVAVWLVTVVCVVVTCSELVV